MAGNEVRILVDGPATHRAMFEAIERARDHVNLQTYILEQGEIAEQLAALLERKVAQGIKASVLYDAVGSLKTPPEYFKRLRESGVKVCAFNPVGKLDELNNRNHRKILVVDGRVAFTGGVNISQAYASGSLMPGASPDRTRRKDGAIRRCRSKGRWWSISSGSSSMIGRRRTAARRSRRGISRSSSRAATRPCAW